MQIATSHFAGRKAVRHAVKASWYFSASAGMNQYLLPANGVKLSCKDTDASAVIRDRGAVNKIISATPHNINRSSLFLVATTPCTKIAMMHTPMIHRMDCGMSPAMRSIVSMPKTPPMPI